jgi:ATP-dependent helicase/nuclease subunit A
MTHFDTEQTRAKDTVGKDIGRSIIVSASAGAGKTTVLVARIVKRCLEEEPPIPIRRIMAVTFTKAAAAEMKRRVFTSFRDALKDCREETKKEYIRAQMIDLNAADITTIDSWCLTIIKKYYNVIGLDPARTRQIVDAGSLGALHAQAFDHAFGELMQADPNEAVELAMMFDPRPERTDELEKGVWKVLDMALSTDDPEQFLQVKCLANYPSVHRLDDLPAPLVDLFYDAFIAKLDPLKRICDRVEKAAVRMDESYVQSVDTVRNQIAVSEEALQSHDWNRFMGTLLPLKQAAFKKKPSKDTSGMGDLYAEAKKPYSETVKNLLASVYRENVLVSDANTLHRRAKVFARLCREVLHETERLKEENACMDFGDLERFALQILKANHDMIADRMRLQYDEIMIDEFQDTSELQNAIIQLIARPDNVFRVGDVKQSIYRFRQAKPSLMRSLLHDEEHQYHISLNHNYRSKESLVTWNNDLYRLLMNIPGFEDTYEGDDIVRIGEGTGQAEKAPVPVEFHLDYTDDEEADGDVLKADWIARKILLMKKEDPSLHYKDFAILTRSHAPKRILNTIFNRYGIPINAITKTGFYNSAVCLVIKAVAGLIRDDTDSIALATVLTSELYGLQEKDLIALKQAYESSHPDEPYSFVKAVRDSQLTVFADMKQLAETAGREGVTAFLKAVGLFNDFYEKLDKKEKANYEYLFEMTLNSEPLSLDDFYDVLEQGRDDSSLEANSFGSDEDAVTVSTFHHSKGIQYDIVFIWSYKAFAAQTGADSIMTMDDRNGLGLEMVDTDYAVKRDTLQHIAASTRDQLAEAQEHIRVMYVATTRARNRMFFVDTVRNQNELYKYFHVQINTQRQAMTQLILRAMTILNRKLISDVSPDEASADENTVRVLSHQIEGSYPYFRLDMNPITDDMIRDVMPVRTDPYRAELPVLKEPPAVLPPLVTPSSREVTVVPPLDPLVQDPKTGTDYGTRMHETVEHLPDRVWTEADITDPELSPRDVQHLIHFSESDIYRKCLSMEIHKEYSFFVIDPERNETLHGSMDFVAFSPEQIILIDFKTDNADPETIQERYTEQLLTYRRALALLQPDTPIAVYAYSFHHEQFIPIK